MKKVCNYSRKGLGFHGGSNTKGGKPTKGNGPEYEWRRKEAKNDKIDSIPSGRHIQNGIVIREREGLSTKKVLQAHDGKGKAVMEGKEARVDEDDSD